LAAVAGFGANTQTLVNAFVGGYYPPAARATALGWAPAVGRIGGIIGPTYGGLIVDEIVPGSWMSSRTTIRVRPPQVIYGVCYERHARAPTPGP
jgi:MFS transporter, AAHS family, benzoate transport protein